jgi:hypothetical protein
MKSIRNYANFSLNEAAVDKGQQVLQEFKELLNSYPRKDYWMSVVGIDTIKPVRTGKLYLPRITTSSFIEKNSDGSWFGTVVGMSRDYSRTEDNLHDLLDYILVSDITRYRPTNIRVDDFSKLTETKEGKEWLLDQMLTAKGNSEIYERMKEKLSGGVPLDFSKIKDYDIPPIALKAGLIVRDYKKYGGKNVQMATIKFDLNQLLKNFLKPSDNPFGIGFTDQYGYTVEDYFYARLRSGAASDEVKFSRDFSDRIFDFNAPASEEEFKKILFKVIGLAAKKIEVFGFSFDNGKSVGYQIYGYNRRGGIAEAKSGEFGPYIDVTKKTLSEIYIKALSDNITETEIESKLKDLLDKLNPLAILKLTEIYPI